MATDPYRYFRVEARELLDLIGAGLLALEKGAAADGACAQLLRAAHTLKGAARVVRQAAIADLTHGLEDMLAPLRAPGMQLEPGLADQALQQLDRINALLAALPAPAPAGGAEPAIAAGVASGLARAAAPSASGQAPPVPERTLESADLAADEGEHEAPLANAALRMTGADLVEVDVLLQGLGEIGGELAAMRQALAALEAGARNSARLPAGQVAQQTAACGRALAGGMERIERELRQARDAAERLRLAPVGSVAGVLERCARDAAVSQGKQVRFEAHAGSLRVDGFVLDLVQGALVQLVRNAVAHGIESAPERRAAGKPDAGRIVLEASRQGARARFRCSDDGRGIDLEAVRGALARAGAAPDELAQDDAGRLLARLFRGGVSTRAEVSELAGRGIGLDVVRVALERLNGTVQARTGPAGTVIDLEVPLTLAALEVLQVEAGGRRLALPLDAVRAALRITPEVVLAGAEGDAVCHAGQAMPLLPLQLDGAPAAAGASRTALVLNGDMPAALGVTRLAGIDTVVLQPPPALAAAAAYVMGIYFDDGGAPGLVLDPAALVAALLKQRGGGAAPARRPLPVLVVDDSLTTRMLECSILESAGFDVALAASAEEGLEMVARTAYGLILCDVEMPGMDGFGFVARIQADPGLRHIPCMLVTSRDAPEDRLRGQQAGARGHIVKSEFDQADFLGRVRDMVLS